MAFRYFFQISCSNNNVPYGLRNNTTALSVRFSSNLNKISVDLQQCQNKQSSSSASFADRLSHSGNCSYNNLVKNKTTIGFLTSKQYNLQENKSAENCPLLFPAKINNSCYLQPLKLGSCENVVLNSSNNNCGTTSDFPLISTKANRKYSISSCEENQTGCGILNNNNDVVKNNSEQNESNRKFKLLRSANTVRTINVRQFSSKKDVDCDSPPAVSRNLTSIDSAYINHKPPNDVPPLKVRRKSFKAVKQPQHECPNKEERTPRADDCYEVKQKKLPILPCPKCPVATEKLSEGKSLSIVKKRPVKEPLKICIETPVYECPPRADDCLKVLPKKLPKINFSNCPKVENCIYDVEPLKPLKKLYVPKPAKIPPKPEVCNVNERADSKATYLTPTLPNVKFDFIPNTYCKPPPDIPLERLPNLQGKDLPRIKCEEVEEKCVKSDDLVPKKIPNALPMLILRPENNYVRIKQYKRAFSTLNRKYSIMSAIRNPWALSLLTANVIAFNYYYNIKPKNAVSAENTSIENEIMKNLSQKPSKTLRKRPSNIVNLTEQCKPKSDTSNMQCLNKSTESTNHLKRIKREPRRNKQLFLQKKTLKKNSNIVTSESGDNEVMCKQTNVLPATKQTEKCNTYARQTQYNNFFKLSNINNWDGQQENIDEPTLTRFWKNTISDTAVLKNSKVSYLIYSVHNHRTIHSSTGHHDKNEKKRKCTNKKCVKIKWPGLPTRQVFTCEEERKPKLYKKQKCPYPSFSESGYSKDFQVCECNELPKSLQPRHKILRKLDLIKPAPPEWSVVDTDYEKKCVMEKLQMPPGETRTCDNFCCPPQHIGKEYLSEEEKECPPKKPKPPISCEPCKLPEATKSREFKFKGPPEETVRSSCPEMCNTDSNQPQKEISSKPDCESPKSPIKQPPKKASKSSESPFSSPKIKCGPVLRSQETVRFASTSARTNVDTNKTKTLWKVFCSVFKENLSKPCEEIKTLCRKLSSEYTSKSQSSAFVKNALETQSYDKKPTEIVPQNNYAKALADLKFTDFFEPLQNCDNISSVNIKMETSKQNENLLINLYKSFNTKSKSNDIDYLMEKVMESKKHCLKGYKSNKFDGKIRTRLSRLHSTTFTSGNGTNKILGNSSFFRLSTSSTSCKSQDDFSNSWMQAEKTKPGLLTGQPPLKSAPNPDCRPESPHLKDSADDHECCKKIKWLDCKTPIMKVCKEDRYQDSCKKEYVHPKCESQKSPFPSFSECHSPVPKYRLTECEVQRRNILVAKQRIQIYSVEKPKHKYCVRCGTKCNKEFSTLASALHSLGFNHCKRYFCTSQKNYSLCTGTKMSQNVKDGIKEQIKTVETGENELDNNSYYKLLKLLETFPEDVVYNFFSDSYVNLSEEQRKSVAVNSQVLDEIKIEQLYNNFCKQICKCKN